MLGRKNRKGILKHDHFCQTIEELQFFEVGEEFSLAAAYK